MRQAIERMPSPVSLAAGAIVLGLAAGVIAVGVDIKIFVAVVLGLVFLASLYRVWLDPRLGLYLAVVTFSLDSLGKLPFSETVPITLYQITIAVTLAAAIRDHRSGARRLVWKKTPLDLPILLFVALAGVSVGFAPVFRVSVITFASLVSSGILFYLLLAMVETRDDARRLILWFLAVGGVLAVLAMAERVTGVSIAGNVMKTVASGIRVRGSFKDPNMFGMLMMMSLAAGLPLLMGEKGRLRLALAGLMVVDFAALGLSFSRGAWVAALVAVVAVVLAYPGDRTKRLVPLVAALVLVVALVFYAVPPEFLAKRIMGVTQDKSALARVYMLRAGADIVRRNPLGVGIGGFPAVYPAYRYGTVRASLVQSHTSYLTVAVEMGVLGLLLYLWLILRFFKTMWPTIRRGHNDIALRVQLAASAAVLGILVQAWTYSVELSKQLWFAMGLAVAAYILASRSQEAND